MSNDSKCILIVDDSRPVRRLVAGLLSRVGYRTVVAGDGFEALQLLYRTRPDLVILDIMMPRMDGLETLRRIRDCSDVPVLILSARDREEDKVLALQGGADDYLTKPFGKREIAARVDALLRRSSASTRGRPPNTLVSACGGDIVVDLQAHSVTVRGKSVKLTPREYELLRVLAQHSGAVVPHETIVRQVWGYDFDGNLNSLKLYVWYLRRKIEPDPAHPCYLITERGVGYQLIRRPYRKEKG